MATRLCHLELRDFRNYERLGVDFDPAANVLLGPNGAGKTNLLEAIFYLALARSPRTSRDADLARHGAAGFIAAGRTEGGASVEIRYDAERGREARLNGKACRTLEQILGSLTAVFFSPDDLWLAKGGPASRRRLLDGLLLQARPSYAAILARYEEALGQRNALLREIRARRAGRAQLAIWDEPLVEYGVGLSRRRAAAVQAVGAVAAEAYAQLAPHERLGCRYAGGVGGELTPEAFRAALDGTRAAELERGFTLVGPHRDDLVLELDGQPVRTHASQGQQRTAVLALRLGERQALLRATGQEPILLLDDVLSELDGRRRAALAELLAGGGQVFLTATDSEVIPVPLRGRGFHVAAGRLDPLAA